MKFFEKYTSATTAAMGNQNYFNENPDTVTKGRVYVKIEVSNENKFSLLYTNIIDSTYADGSHCCRNLVIDEWEMVALRVGIVSAPWEEPENWIPVTFEGGKPSKTVAPGEIFATDEFSAEVKKGEFFCIECEFRGTMMPFHTEINLSCCTFHGGAWVENRVLPVPSMVGCAREDKPVRVAFWGDSITQGIGTPPNSYLHYASVVAGILGEKYAYWDIALGYARGDDAATRGVWMYKALQNDVISVCFGVNDLLQGVPADTIKKDLTVIVTELKKAGKKVVIQTIPPFDYGGETVGHWEDINAYIRDVLAPQCDGFFDNVAILGGKNGLPQCTKFGGHPDARGHRPWGEGLAEVIGKVIEG